MISMVGLYRPRRTPMHATPAGVKVFMLVALAIGTVVISDPVTSLGIMAACLLLLASAEPPFKPTVLAMVGTLIVAALTSALHIWRGDYDRAVDIAADLIAIVALALAVTCSTSMEAMLDFVSRIARPIRFILPPETLGLMFALMLRALPEVVRMYYESKMAARARGLDRSVKAIVFPTTTRTVGFALQLGQALHARGIAEEARETRRSRRAEKEAEEQRKRRRERRARKAHPGASASAASSATAASAASAAEPEELAETNAIPTPSGEMTKDDAFALLASPHHDDANGDAEAPAPAEQDEDSTQP